MKWLQFVRTQVVGALAWIWQRLGLRSVFSRMTAPLMRRPSGKTTLVVGKAVGRVVLLWMKLRLLFMYFALRAAWRYGRKRLFKNKVSASNGRGVWVRLRATAANLAAQITSTINAAWTRFRQRNSTVTPVAATAGAPLVAPVESS